VPTVRTLLDEAKAALRAAPFRPPAREAHLLLGRVLGVPEGRLLARDDLPVQPAQAAAFRALVARRLTGEPVAYLVGEREFYGRSFVVDPRVLVPRPETEHLVEAALALALPKRGPQRVRDRPRVLDVGVGSGAIAVTLALERPGWRLIGSDLSLGALAVARNNARRLGVDLALLRADLFELSRSVDLGALDLMVSNPPYIDPTEALELSPEVTRFEPSLSLFAGPDGPDGPDSRRRGAAAVAALIRQGEALASGVAMVLEVGHEQMPRVRELAEAGPWTVERVVTDYSGVERVAVLRRR